MRTIRLIGAGACSLGSMLFLTMLWKRLTHDLPGTTAAKLFIDIVVGGSLAYAAFALGRGGRKALRVPAETTLASTSASPNETVLTSGPPARNGNVGPQGSTIRLILGTCLGFLVGSFVAMPVAAVISNYGASARLTLGCGLSLFAATAVVVAKSVYERGGSQRLEPAVRIDSAVARATSGAKSPHRRVFELAFVAGALILCTAVLRGDAARMPLGGAEGLIFIIVGGLAARSVR